QSLGATAGHALDALTAQLGGPAETTLIVVQPMQPDTWFTAQQRQRLEELMARWRAARDSGTCLPPDEQAGLESPRAAALPGGARAGGRCAAPRRSAPQGAAMTPNYPAVARRAGHRCEYCHAPEAVFNFPFEVEHVRPACHGGADDESNLCLACRACNVRKGD